MLGRVVYDFFKRDLELVSRNYIYRKQKRCLHVYICVVPRAASFGYNAS